MHAMWKGGGGGQCTREGSCRWTSVQRPPAPRLGTTSWNECSCSLFIHQVVGSIKYSAPLLALSLSPQRSHLVVGMSDNTLCVRRLRPKGLPVEAGTAGASATAGSSIGDFRSYGRPGQVVESAPGIASRYDGTHPGTYRFFLRGRTHAPQDEDVIVRERGNPHKLSSFDKALKSFNYHAALDAALQNGSPEVVVSVVEELVRRNGLRAALSGRDQLTLQPLLSFLINQITLPPFAGVFISVANLLLDMCSLSVVRLPQSVWVGAQLVCMTPRSLACVTFSQGKPCGPFWVAEAPCHCYRVGNSIVPTLGPFLLAGMHLCSGSLPPSTRASSSCAVRSRPRCSCRRSSRSSWAQWTSFSLVHCPRMPCLRKPHTQTSCVDWAAMAVWLTYRPSQGRSHRMPCCRSPSVRRCCRPRPS